MGRVGAFDSRPSVHHGQEQCPRRRSLSTQLNPGFRMNSEAGSVPGSTETMAGDDRPLRHLVESPMFTIFFAIPRSECSVLASAALVSGTSRSRSGWSSSASFVSRSAQTVSFQSPSSRNIQAVPSWMETLQ